MSGRISRCDSSPWLSPRLNTIFFGFFFTPFHDIPQCFRRSEKPRKHKEFPGFVSISIFSFDYLLENCGARRAALRPYCVPFWADFPWYSGVFQLSVAHLSYVVTTKINGISINDCLMKSAVHNSEQLFRFIIFHFRWLVQPVHLCKDNNLLFLHVFCS